MGKCPPPRAMPSMPTPSRSIACARPEDAMSSDLRACSCVYEERMIAHTVHYRGELIVIDHVPADVCTICGDVLLKPETVRKIEKLLRQRSEPANMVPLYEY